MRARALAIALVAPLAIAGCLKTTTGSFAHAYQATNRDQLVGGIAAIGDVGDFVLENDQVRFVILNAHGSPGPGIFGGSLADADLQRPQAEYRGGHGLDALSEIFPLANLATPAPQANQVSIENTGEDGDEAVITVHAAADNYMKALEALKIFGVPMDVEITTRYRLAPGSRVLRLDSTLEFDPENSGDRETTPMTPLTTPPDIFGTILRLPTQPSTTAPGAVAGDFLFYGNKTDVFTPEYGFDIDHKLRQIFNGGCDSVNVPLGVDGVAAEGDKVSYAYATADDQGGQTYVPLFASSFTAVLTNVFQCQSRASCLGDKRLTFSRYFAVGDGDEASAWREIEKAKHIATGELDGHLYDSLSGTPVSGARVIAIRDPGRTQLPDSELASKPVDELMPAIYAANEASSQVPCPDGTCAKCSPKVDPYGAPGIVASMKTDRGTDKVLDGDFSAALPPGDYLLVARNRIRPTSRPVRVHIEAGHTTRLNLTVDPPATLTVHITDQAGRPSPGKLTLGHCLPECATDGDCATGYCDTNQRRCEAKTCRDNASAAGCTCDAHATLDVALGDPLNPDNIVMTTFAGSDGTAELQTRPGNYDLLVSRGIEYDLDRQQVTLDPRRPVIRQAAVHHVVDSTGWISADFHVHGIASHDAFVTNTDRVLSMMGEGVELLSSSDHDAITDFAPQVRELKAQPFIKTQVGLETTTVEMGHFIGEPLRYDDLAGEGPDGAAPGLLGKTNGAFDWYGLPPGKASYCDLNHNGRLDPYEGEQAVPLGDPGGECHGAPVETDPGIFGRLRALGLYGPDETVVTVPHPRDGFFGYFEQFGLNPFSLLLPDGDSGPKYGTTLESAALNEALQPGLFSTSFDALELFNGKRFDMVRTPTISEAEGFHADMQALRAQGLPNDELEKKEGAVGDTWVRKVLERTPEEESTILASAGRDACMPTLCDPETNACAAGYECDQSNDAWKGECLQKCTATTACLPQNGTCDETRGVCTRDLTEPCVDHRGVVDDWFRMLNGGAQFTGLGNSDTHTLLSNESGLPRNFVKSKTDEPRAIDPEEIARNVLHHDVVASYGPFIRMDANGVDIGGTLVHPAPPVNLHVEVESPLWFDVDRLEVYRNGELWKVVSAGDRDPECPTIDSVPNKGIVNFECTFVDTPEKDSWYVAIALGLKGKDLRPIYSSVPILYLEIGDITSRAFSVLGSFLPPTAEVPRQFPIIPYAVTNPIWVDLKGDGFDPPVPLDPRSPFALHASTSQPLSSVALTSPMFPDDDSRVDGSARLLEVMQLKLEHALEPYHQLPPVGDR